MTKQIALIGFGCVAQGFYQQLKASKLNISVKYICVKESHKERDAPAALITTNLQAVLEDPALDMIVELISDDQVAYDIAIDCLTKKKPLISASKKMIAEHLQELLDLQESPYYYEGAVAGSIPIIQTSNQYYSDQEITSVRGILNGSSNYILTQLFRQNTSLEKALSEAQQKGFAEKDPALDISGRDAAHKLSILSFHLFGQYIEPLHIQTEHLDMLDPLEISDAKKAGNKIKQIATLVRSKTRLIAQVALTEITPEDPLFFVDDEYNAIQINTSNIGQQLLYGKGAGSFPTGAAVLNDLKSWMAMEQASKSAGTLNGLATY
ncbi:MAG: homoserine dehydrogenase [Cyclobacteriaceae bacterium]|jgi:homoserine dehydrogenase